MRPVEKESAPHTYSKYGDAIDDLTECLGRYCSYCERRLPASLAVEHICPKSLNPSREVDWSNFLLACTNCNSVKGNRNIKESYYLWPDRDNTMMAISYTKGGFVQLATGLTAIQKRKAKALINLVGLDRHIARGYKNPSKRDKRWSQREEIWAYALNAREDYESLMGDSEAAARRLVVRAAKGYGFFSVWMKVFDHYPQVKNDLINEFKGSATSCFNANADIVNRPGGTI